MSLESDLELSFFSDQGTTVCRTAALGAAVIILFTSRACYNLAVLILSKKYPVESFNYDWYNVSDQVINAKSYLFYAVRFSGFSIFIPNYNIQLLKADKNKISY